MGISEQILENENINVTLKTNEDKTALDLMVADPQLRNNPKNQNIFNILLLEPDRDFKTNLHRAAEAGDEESLSLLLNNPFINVNMKDTAGDTPLHLAIKTAHIECISLLLKQKDINIYIQNKDDKTPGQLALQSTNEKKGEILSLFIEHNHPIFPSSGVTSTKEEKANDPINQKDGSGLTQLHKAVKNEDASTLISLLNKPSVDVNRRDNTGFTALYYAACYGKTECVRLLLNHKDVNVNLPRNGNGFTPLHTAVCHDHPDCVKLLLAHNDIEVNKPDTDPDRDRFTPLHLAVSNGHVECVRALLTHKAIDTNTRNTKGQTPLACAYENSVKNMQVIIDLLLEHGASR